MDGPEQADFLTFWQFLVLDSSVLETCDLVVMNLAVARGIPGLENLDIRRYVGIVDEWTREFRHVLPAMERRFGLPHER